ncbi:MAG: ABC transporter permease [Ruminococcus sp.]
MKSLIFAKRNTKEILRDPMSYIFILGFPVILLIVFQIISNSLPENAPKIFSLNFLSSGIAVFSFSFVMLYMSLLVSGDRTTTFLSRLYTSPMKSTDFILGYTLPGMAISMIQLIVCYITVALLHFITGDQIDFLNLIITIPVFIPVMLLFVALGVISGSLFSSKSAPGICSVVINVAGFLGGVWMPVNEMGAYETVCEFLPFYPAVQIGRSITYGNDITGGKIPIYVIISIIYILVFFILSIIIFNIKTKQDNK